MCEPCRGGCNARSCIGYRRRGYNGRVGRWYLQDLIHGDHGRWTLTRKHIKPHADTTTGGRVVAATAAATATATATITAAEQAVKVA